MKMGKWELVSGCGRELWLNPPPPPHSGASIAASTGWGIRVRLREPDIKPTARHDILFSWAALTQIQLSTYYFLMPAVRGEVAPKKKRRKGKLAPAGRLPDVRAAPSLLIQIICGLFSWRRIKTFHLSELFLIERNPWPPSAFKLSRRNTIACACNCICQSPRECKTCGQAFSACMIPHVCEWKGARGDTVAGSFAV